MNGILVDDAEAVAGLPAIETAPIEGQACLLENYLSQPDHTMDARIAAARAKLGKEAVVLGHHYQRDEVIQFADFTGDSYKLSKIAAETDARYILFCGVHFMAESADVLAKPWQQVILPDLNAGCSMADMAEIGQVEDCWDALGASLGTDGIVPLTYMNSAADIKAFCGERGGLVCTSSNARGAFEWAFARGNKILFLPDQHLGRNTAFSMGIPLNEMVVWDPYMINGGVAPDRLKAAKVILWKGHCSVHQRFLPEHVDRVRRDEPGMQVIVHPECRWEVCQKADALGSTERLIELIEKSPEGSSFAVGTEIHLVNRLAARFAPLGKRVITLDDSGCLCTTMYRISPAHLAWALESLVAGKVVNQIKVSEQTKHWAKVALDRMLEVPTAHAIQRPI
ncbi:quinolinate synthase NadA [Granulicella sp. WH15]|uniref:quinolinate synthase NadA n=1 Tax=Granulicella sp. WH15 TaxID=2602070 RepID=UPI001366B184|nr:quinolinate synthase NadA [Granulicella sp. WH15]QHN04561.1 quinolinate synthase NadA [Granulicella sp. WH15]